MVTIEGLVTSRVLGYVKRVQFFTIQNCMSDVSNVPILLALVPVPILLVLVPVCLRKNSLRVAIISSVAVSF